MEATNTSPLKKDGMTLTRRFLGELFPKNTMEVNELKAYLKGKTRYRFGRDSEKNPIYHPVRQEYKYI